MEIEQNKDPIEVLKKLADDLDPNIAYETLRALESIMNTQRTCERAAFNSTCPVLTKSYWNEVELLANRVTELKGRYEDRYEPHDFQI